MRAGEDRGGREREREHTAERGEGAQVRSWGINASEGKWVRVIKCHGTEDKWVRKVREETTSMSRCTLRFNAEILLLLSQGSRENSILSESDVGQESK